MIREETSEVIKLLGKRIIIDVWKCYDRHVEKFGIPTEEVGNRRYVDISSIDNKVILRFEFNKSYVIVYHKSIQAEIAIVNLEDREIMLTKSEAIQIFDSEEVKTCTA